MAGLKGFSRLPNTNVDPRVRRQSQNLADDLEWISDAEVVSITGDGILTVSLGTNGGLVNTSGELFVDLDSPSGLQLGSGGISVDPVDPIEVTADGVKLTARFINEHNHAYSQPVVPVAHAALTQVATEEAAEEAIVTALTFSWMGF